MNSGSTAYRGVLISGCWNRGASLYTEMCPHFRGEGGIAIGSGTDTIQEHEPPQIKLHSNVQRSRNSKFK